MSRFQDRRNQQKRGQNNEYISKNEQSILHVIFCEVYGAQDAFSIAVEKVPVQMSTVFSNLVVLAWLALQRNQRLASSVLEHWKPTSYKRWDVSRLDKWRCVQPRRGARPFLLRKRKKRTQFHYFCPAVLGKQRDSKMEHFLYTHPLCCPTRPKLPAHTEGSAFAAAEKNKPIHSCFTWGAAKTPGPSTAARPPSQVCVRRHQRFVPKCGGQKKNFPKIF